MIAKKKEPLSTGKNMEEKQKKKREMTQRYRLEGGMRRPEYTVQNVELAAVEKQISHGLVEHIDEDLFFLKTLNAEKDGMLDMKFFYIKTISLKGLNSIPCNAHGLIRRITLYITPENSVEYNRRIAEYLSIRVTLAVPGAFVEEVAPTVAYQNSSQFHIDNAESSPIASQDAETFIRLLQAVGCMFEKSDVLLWRIDKVVDSTYHVHFSGMKHIDYDALCTFVKTMNHRITDVIFSACQNQNTADKHIQMSVLMLMHTMPDVPILPMVRINDQPKDQENIRGGVFTSIASIPMRMMRRVLGDTRSLRPRFAPYKR